MSLFRATALVLLPTLCVGAVILTGSARPLQAAASNQPSAELVGVMVNREVADSGSDMPQLAFQGTFARTKLALAINSPTGGLIGLDRDASKVGMFADDTGQVLADTSSNFNLFGFGERILSEGNRLTIELDGNEAPAENAKVVRAQGVLVVRIAHETRTWTSESAAAAKGTSYEVGPFTFKVLETGEASWGEGYEIECETQADLDSIIKFEAVAPDGTVHELNRVSTMTFGDTSRVTFVSKVELKTAALRAEAWHGAKKVRVPFNVKAGVALK